MPYTPRFVVGLFNGPEDQTNSHRAMHHMLRALFEIDKDFLIANPSTPNIYESGVVYREEPPGYDDWADIPTVLLQRWGDCEDLACWRAAELFVRHHIDVKPTFVWKMMPDGGQIYHIQVLYPDGKIEDPSRILGMR